jgi:hypothetical protein
MIYFEGTAMKKWLFLLMLAAAGPSYAAQNALKSCYELARLQAPAARTDTALFVVIDQTVELDKLLRASLVENIRPLLKPGNAFTVVQFSAFSQGRYASTLTSGVFSPQLSNSQRDDIGKPQLQVFDQCIRQQQRAGARLVGDALSSALAGSRGSLNRSDILSTLKELGPQIKRSPARNKVLLLSSDMLENSSISSFYAKNNVRKIDAVAEMKKVHEHELLTDFGGARVYVLGAGLVIESAKGTYRDPMAMSALETFWRDYFKQSNAIVGEFGKPALLNLIQ